AQPDAGPLLEVGNELLVQVLPQLPRRVVGDVEEFRRGGVAIATADAGHEEESGDGEGKNRSHGSPPNGLVSYVQAEKILVTRISCRIKSSLCSSCLCYIREAGWRQAIKNRTGNRRAD